MSADRRDRADTGRPASLSGPSLDFSTMGVLLGPAIVVALVSFAETYSVGKAISTGTKQKVDVNQEFIGRAWPI